MGIFEAFTDDEMELFGKMYFIIIIVIFNLVLINLIISMLANTYGIYDSSSDGFLFSQILQSRDELVYDPYFGCIFSQLPPTNLL